MTITAWRIFQKEYHATAFTGTGAERFGGRWNSKGVAVIYTAESRSLAVLEMLVHLDVKQALSDYVLQSIAFDDGLVEAVDRAALPRDWHAEPPPPLREIGDRWMAEGRSAVLRVPSAVMQMENNFLINPSHRDFKKCLIGSPEAFKFDARLLG